MRSTVLPRNYDIVIPEHYRRNYEDAYAFAEAIYAALQGTFVVTSFYRTDETRHAYGLALDVADRSGSRYDDARSGKAAYYEDTNYLAKLRAILQTIGADHPRVERLVVEADHLHIDLLPVGSERGYYRPILARFSPPVYRGTAATPGRFPILRTELDDLRLKPSTIR